MRKGLQIFSFILGIFILGGAFLFLFVDTDTNYTINFICFLMFFVLGIFCLYLSREFFQNYKIDLLQKKKEQIIEKQNTNILQKQDKLKEEIENLKQEKEVLLKSKDVLQQENKGLIFEKNELISKLNNFREKIGKDNIEYVDELDGLDFEEYIKELLEKLGYTKVIRTPASGDFGVDVIAEKDNIKYGIQCKNYKDQIGNKSVQEAFSGKQHYGCHVGVVVTNSYFSTHAIEQAESLGVILWDRNKLISMIDELKK